MRRLPVLLAAICAIALALFLPGAAVAGPAPHTDPAPTELAYACALKSNGLLRQVSSLSQCKNNETKVTFKPGPVLICVQPSGSTRLTATLGACKKPALAITLPPTSGTVYFCVTTTTGAVRYVTDPSQCVAGELPYQVTPNDAAPAVLSTSPVAAATHVATNTTVAFTWSEAVTVSATSFTLVCAAVNKTFSVSGSGSTLTTLTPLAALPEGTSCTATALAAQVSDVDVNDPPDHPVANSSVTFTTDAAPTVVSMTPVDGATGVDPTAALTVQLSEPVTLDSGALDLMCGDFTHYALTVSGDGSSTITADPQVNPPPGVQCTLTVDLTKVHDVDSGDPPDIGVGSVSSTFTTADTAPSVTSTTPTDGASQIATTSNVAFTWSESVTATAAAFTLVCGANADAQPFSLSGSPGSVVTLDPTNPLPEGTSCTATALAASISDTDLVDPPDHPANDTSVTFTTDAAPSVLSTTPADGASGVLTGDTLQVVFSEPVNVAAGAFTLSCDSVDQPLGVSGDGTDTLTLTPNSALPGTASCTLTVHASLVSDVDAGDPPDHLASDVTATFATVDAAPSVTSTIPADGATGVSRSTTIGITFTEAVTFDAGAFAVECPAGTPVGFGVTPGGSSATLTPTTSLPAGVTCTVTVTASKVHDSDLIDPPDTMASDFTFSFGTTANSAPTDLALSPSSIAENQPSGTAVGTLTTTDPDVGDTFTYALVTGTGDTDNGSFTIDGDQLKTAASFDFETKASYSIRVQSTDSGSATFEKVLTVTVTDVNEAPTDITLSNAAIDENQPSGSTIGTVGGTDPDIGQTLVFTLEASGCGGSFPDNGSFSITGTTLKSAASFNFEAKSSYAVCLRATDNGTPVKSFDKQFTINVNDVNDPPVAAPQSYSGVAGNTLAVRGTTSSSPNIAITGNLLGVGATDEDSGDTVSVVAETVASTKGGSASINADGSFTYLPPVGLKSTTDTFTFHVSDGHVQSAGTATMTISGVLIWYVDNASAAGDGRSTAPLNALTSLDGAGGVGDVDGSGDTIFVYTGNATYAGGLVLEANQTLLGSPAGLSAGPTVILAPAGAAPVITNASGNGLDLASGVSVQGVSITGASADGINGVSIATASIGTSTAVTVSGAGADGVDLSGPGSGAIQVGATVTNSTARSVAVSGRSGGATTFTGAITGKGVELVGNTGATIAFTGALTVSTTTTPAFSATGGGTVTATNSANTLTSTTGRALDVTDTTIGAADLTFTSISANGAVNGIRLSNTGGTGGLNVLGNGSTARGGNGSGGTIQNTTGVGVLLATTKDVSLNNLTVSGTPNGAGIAGTAVTNFAFTNGTVTNSGLTSKGTGDSNIAFDSAASPAANVTGTVTITNSSLTNAYEHGVHVQNYSGTVSALNVSNNTVTSTASTATSAGNGIFLQVGGSGGTAAAVSAGTVNGNTVTGFPNGAGIAMLTGNEQFAAAPSVTFGSGPGASAVQVNGNLVNGFGTGLAGTATPRMGAECILFVMAGHGTAFVDVTNNGTAGQPLGLNAGNCVSVNSEGATNVTSQITGNVVKPQAQLSGSFGMTGGADKQVYAGGTLDTAVLQANIASNTVSSTTGVGIYFIANSSAQSYLKVQNNNAAAPTDAASRPGIRVDSGTSAGTALNTTVCLTISGNTSAGQTGAGTLFPGIGLRKQGTVSTTNTFGITGLAPSPATAAQTESYVSSQNPSSASGGFGTGGTAVISGSNFVSCTMPTF